MRLKLHQSGPWIGFGGIFMELFVAFPALFSSQLPHWKMLVPASGIAAILGLLLVQAVIVTRLAKSRPAWCAFVPPVGLVAYFVLLFVGLKWWGWAA